jgi:hypothetical protein
MISSRAEGDLLLADWLVPAPYLRRLVLFPGLVSAWPAGESAACAGGFLDGLADVLRADVGFPGAVFAGRYQTSGSRPVGGQGHWVTPPGPGGRVLAAATGGETRAGRSPGSLRGSAGLTRKKDLSRARGSAGGAGSLARR